MNILVSGVTAYAGFHAAAALSRAGHRVVGLTRNPTSRRADELRQAEVQLLRGDVAQPETYREALAACDVMVHSMLDPADPLGTDEKLFATLAAVGQSPSAPGRRRLCIYTTGCSVYGKVPAPVLDEATPGNPTHALHFRMELEQRLFDLHAPGWRRVVVRPGFMYGLDARNSISAQWFQMGTEGRPVFRGDRDKGWSWVHIADLADATVRLAESTLDGEVFCLADDQRPACVPVMRACLDAAGHTGPITFAPPEEGDPVGTWFDQNEFISSAKARRLLGWHARHRGILDDVPTHFAAWRAAQERSAG